MLITRLIWYYINYHIALLECNRWWLCKYLILTSYTFLIGSWISWCNEILLSRRRTKSSYKMYSRFKHRVYHWCDTFFNWKISARYSNVIGSWIRFVWNTWNRRFVYNYYYFYYCDYFNCHCRLIWLNFHLFRRKKTFWRWEATLSST